MRIKVYLLDGEKIICENVNDWEYKTRNLECIVSFGDIQGNVVAEFSMKNIVGFEVARG